MTTTMTMMTTTMMMTTAVAAAISHTWDMEEEEGGWRENITALLSKSKSRNSIVIIYFLFQITIYPASII